MTSVKAFLIASEPRCKSSIFRKPQIHHPWCHPKGREEPRTKALIGSIGIGIGMLELWDKVLLIGKSTDSPIKCQR
ncbi:hypothetical protein AFLA_005787 [Aspergillus flavus NRRL3357]|nr:hypothetical protein AFLA_005787 [Aspergillus flavus NRRL3357]